MLANTTKGISSSYMDNYLILLDRIFTEGVRIVRSEFNNDLAIFDGAGGYDDGKRMSSKEIAKVTGKLHQHVMRDIRKLIEQGVQETNFGLSFIIRKLPNGGTKKTPFYQLTKKGCLILASGYNAKLREAIINRWAELELRNLEEERDPSKAVDRAVSTWRRQGKTDSWIQTRTSGIAQRHVYTDTLKAHGVEGQGYGQCTNAIYKPILGGTKSEIVKKRNLPVKVNLRDSLTGVELAGVMLAEAIATDRIEEHNAKGNEQCASHSKIAAISVSKAITEGRK